MKSNDFTFNKNKMKTKTLTLMSLNLLALVLLASFASAAFELTPSTLSKTITSGTTSVSFDIAVENDGAGGDYSLTWNGTTNHGNLVFPTLTTSHDNQNESTSFSVNSIPSTFVGTITGTLIAESSLVDRTIPFTITVNEDTSSSDPEEVNDCKAIGNPGSDLRIKSIDFTNKGMKTGNSPIEFGDDDAWFPLDDIEVEVKVENNGNDDIDNIEVQWGLWDSGNDEWIIELDDEKDFDLKDDDDETLTISFNLESSLDIDLEDLTDGTYQFYVIATGESQEIDDDVCTYDYEDTDIVIERDFVVATNFEFLDTVSCGDELQVVADVWNIGERDEDNVYVRVYNTELGINQIVDIGDINAFDKEDLLVNLEIPENAKEKTYSINFDVYDDGDDIFETKYDDDKAEFHILVTVDRCTVEAKAIVSARLESGGVAGQELVVRATIVNSGDDTAAYDINLARYASWADTANVETKSITLDKGESKDVLMRFNVKSDVSGEQAFDIEVLSQGELVLIQPVSVSIEAKKGGLFSGITGGAIGTGNTYLWIIGALNVILVVIIIIVAIRVARK